MKIQDTEILDSMPASLTSFVINAIQKHKSALDLSTRQAKDLIEKVAYELPLSETKLISLESLHNGMKPIDILNRISHHLPHHQDGSNLYFAENDGKIEMCLDTANAELMRGLQFSARNNTAANAILESDLVLSTAEFKQMIAVEAITGDNNAPSYPHMMVFAELFDIMDLRKYDPYGKTGGQVYSSVVDVDPSIAQKMGIPTFSKYYESTIIAHNDEAALQIFAKHLPTDLGLSKNGFWYAIHDEMVKSSGISLAISTKSEREAALLYDQFFSDTDSIRCGFVSAPAADEAPVIKRGTHLSGKMRI